MQRTAHVQAQTNATHCSAIQVITHVNLPALHLHLLDITTLDASAKLILNV